MGTVKEGEPQFRGSPNCVELMTLPAERIVILSPTHAAEPRVPVTAKLSKRFYDVLGEDVAGVRSMAAGWRSCRRRGQGSCG